MNEYINGKINPTELENIGENGNFCFSKIEFYLNGEIKNYYLPKGFSQYDVVYIEDISQLIIPKYLQICLQLI